MKINLQPLFNAFDSMTIFRLFSIVIIIPAILAVIAMYLIEHTGTSHLATHEVDMDISIGGVPKGTFSMALFGNSVPKTVKNFETFATKGFEGKKYEGTVFHRVVNKMMIQGGDVLKGVGHPEGLEGEGKISIYGETFDDENFLVKHAAPGFVSMTNGGPNTNGCQFFITLRAMAFMDGRNVVFGKVTRNMALLYVIEAEEVDEKERPLNAVVITKVQMRTIRSPYYISDDPFNIWSWLYGMSVPIFLCSLLCGFFTWLMNFLDRGIVCSDAEDKLYKKEAVRSERRNSGKIYSLSNNGLETQELELDTQVPEETTRRRKGADEVEEAAKPAAEEVVEDDASKPKAT